MLYITFIRWNRRFTTRVAFSGLDFMEAVWPGGAEVWVREGLPPGEAQEFYTGFRKIWDYYR